jgi:hypothetical protein
MSRPDPRAILIPSSSKSGPALATRYVARKSTLPATRVRTYASAGIHTVIAL